MRSGDGDAATPPEIDEAVVMRGSEHDRAELGRAPLDRADPADARPPLEVLESIEVSSVLALGHEGTAPVDWASLVPDTTGACPECGLPDGPKHAARCLAHPPATNVWAVVLTCLLVPLPLTLLAGPYAYGFFVPTIAVALYVRSR